MSVRRNYILDIMDSYVGSLQFAEVFCKHGRSRAYAAARRAAVRPNGPSPASWAESNSRPVATADLAGGS
jgi:hypothetical protein